MYMHNVKSCLCQLPGPQDLSTQPTARVIPAQCLISMHIGLLPWAQAGLVQFSLALA